MAGTYRETMMSRLKLEGVCRTKVSSSRETAMASSNQVLMVVAVISPSIRVSTLAQISAGEFIPDTTPFV